MSLKSKFFATYEMTLRDEASRLKFCGSSLNHCTSTSGSSLNFSNFMSSPLPQSHYTSSSALEFSSCQPHGSDSPHHLDLHRIINCSGKVSLTTSLLPITLSHSTIIYSSQDLVFGIIVFMHLVVIFLI